MGISSLVFSSAHCLTGMPEAHSTGNGQTPIFSNFNTAPSPILTSPSILETSLCTVLGGLVTFTTCQLALDSCVQPHHHQQRLSMAFQGKAPNCSLLAPGTGSVVQQDTAHPAWHCSLHRHTRLLKELLLLSILPCCASSKRNWHCLCTAPKREIWARSS